MSTGAVSLLTKNRLFLRLLQHAPWRGSQAMSCKTFCPAFAMKAYADVAPRNEINRPRPLHRGHDSSKRFSTGTYCRRRSLHQRRARYERLPRYRLTLAGQVGNFVIKIDLHEVNRTGWTGLLRGWIATRCSLSRGLVCNGRRATRKKPRTGLWRLREMLPSVEVAFP